MDDTATQKSLVRDWMLQDVHRVDWNSTVRDVLELMKREGLTSVPITNGGGQASETPIAGIVTLGDLARVVLSTDQVLDSDYPHYEDCFWAVDLIQRKLGSDKVTEVMSENVASIGPNQTMREAAKLMTEKGIHHLAVTTKTELVGMLAASDFVRMVATE